MRLKERGATVACTVSGARGIFAIGDMAVTDKPP
jgi:hypothetical protein